MGSVRYVRGVRNSGIVAGNHTNRRDIFYLYKSQWNRRGKTLHIADKQQAIRANEKLALTVYSSMGAPTILVNDDTIACRNIARTIYRTDTLTLKGSNKIRVSVGDAVEETTVTIGNYLKVQ
jgi:beta-galactosidase